MKDYVSLGLAWGGAVASAVTNHISLIVSVAAGLAALTASIYSILINRAKWRKIKAHEETLCRICHQAPGSIECPYPEDDRPDNCIMKDRKIHADEVELCRLCALHPGTVACPFSEKNRPAGCTMNK